MAHNLDALDEFSGRLVRLRGLRTEDGPAFAAMDRDTDGARLSHETYLPRTDNRQAAWVETEVAKDRSGHNAFLVVARLEDDSAVGSMSVVRADPRHGRFGYGIALGHDHRQKGYGSDAVKLLLGFYFGELRYVKCDTSIYSFNQPSLRMHERLGFQEEGRIRNAIFTRGQHHDEVIMGITADEFASPQ